MSALFKSFFDFLKPSNIPSADEMNRERLFDTLKSYEEGANKFITWSLSIIGGSLLAIINDSYLHPESRLLKSGYFLFLLGWASLGKVIYHGNKIARTNILLPMNKNNTKQLIADYKICNSNYSSQMKYFNWALLVFGIWLTAYLVWWVLTKDNINIIHKTT
jgi:hypothetical protein